MPKEGVQNQFDTFARFVIFGGIVACSHVLAFAALLIYTRKLGIEFAALCWRKRILLNWCLPCCSMGCMFEDVLQEIVCLSAKLMF